MIKVLFSDRGLHNWQKIHLNRQISWKYGKMDEFRRVIKCYEKMGFGPSLNLLGSTFLTRST